MNRPASEPPRQGGREAAPPVGPLAGTEGRAERLGRIRSEIRRGEYDTPERFEAALDRMLETLDLPG